MAALLLPDSDRAGLSSRQRSRQGVRGSISSERSRSTQGKREGKKKKKKDKGEDNEEELPPPPKPAWAMFSEHVKEFTMSNLVLGEKKETYSHMCSPLHTKVLNDIKRGMRGQALNMTMRIRAIKTIEAAMDEPDSDTDPETDSEEEDEDPEEKIRRQAKARQHWGVIRRYVQDRTKQRRLNKGAYNKEKTLNKLRAQARLQLKPDQVRRELFEKYGVVPKPGKIYPEDSMRPVFSQKAKDIIAKFEQIQVHSIKVRPKTTGYDGAEYEVYTTVRRPRTIHTYTKPLNL